MDIDFAGLADSVLRWLHVVAGIAWIGHLYFFNFVNANFVGTMDAETKKKVVPELMPRALFLFRWGAAWTWLTGVGLLVLVFYHGKTIFENPAEGKWSGALIGCAVLAFVGQHVYELLVKTVLKDPKVLFLAGWVLASGAWFLFRHVGGMGYRGAWIHLGAMFGTIMAFNVWFRIWPAQRKILRGIKDGPPADPSVAALAGARSKHNTYMSVPLVFAMLNSHTASLSGHDWAPPAVILLGWLLVSWLYNKARSEAPKWF